jgi:hypothetical protein
LTALLNGAAIAVDVNFTWARYVLSRQSAGRPVSKCHHITVQTFIWLVLVLPSTVGMIMAGISARGPHQGNDWYDWVLGLLAILSLPAHIGWDLTLMGAFARRMCFVAKVRSCLWCGVEH